MRFAADLLSEPLMPMRVCASEGLYVALLTIGQTRAQPPDFSDCAVKQRSAIIAPARMLDVGKRLRGTSQTGGNFAPTSRFWTTISRLSDQGWLFTFKLSDF
jgi:hypothetical protein